FLRSPPHTPASARSPYTTLFRSVPQHAAQLALVEQFEDALGAADGGVARVASRREGVGGLCRGHVQPRHRLPRGRRQLTHDPVQDRKSTRLNSSHVKISYAVFCL